LPVAAARFRAWSRYASARPSPRRNATVPATTSAGIRLARGHVLVPEDRFGEGCGARVLPLSEQGRVQPGGHVEARAQNEPSGSFRKSSWTVSRPTAKGWLRATFSRLGRAAQPLLHRGLVRPECLCLTGLGALDLMSRRRVRPPDSIEQLGVFVEGHEVGPGGCPCFVVADHHATLALRSFSRARSR